MIDTLTQVACFAAGNLTTMWGRGPNRRGGQTKEKLQLKQTTPLLGDHLFPHLRPVTLGRVCSQTRA